MRVKIRSANNLGCKKKCQISAFLLTLSSGLYTSNMAAWSTFSSITSLHLIDVIIDFVQSSYTCSALTSPITLS